MQGNNAPVGTALKRPIDRLAYRRNEAAAALGIGLTEFDAWVKDGIMPAGYAIKDRCVLYDAAEIHAAWEALKTRARDARSVDTKSIWDGPWNL